MTEKEKMMAGIVYSVLDEELIRLHRACVDACALCDRLLPSQLEARREHLARILGKTGEHFSITTPFWCDYGYNIEIGDHFYTNHNCVILDCAKVTFGNYVFIAPDCVFSTAGHPLDAPQRNQGLEYAYPITVGDNVWFGASVTVLPGVTIGSNTVIGAGSLVNRDIPDGVVAVGNPCRVLRKITEADKEKYRRYHHGI